MSAWACKSGGERQRLGLIKMHEEQVVVEF